MHKIEEIQQMVRNLRDSKNHVCPANEDPTTDDCTCGEYDAVIDKLEDLKITL